MKLFGNKIPFFQKGRSETSPKQNKSKEDFNARIAIFGDIHSNLEALTAVLADANQQEITRFACTGDLVGYGANPSECLERVKALDCPLVKGNHDEYSATDISLSDFTLNAMNSLIWTRQHLTPEERAWLDTLPLQKTIQTSNKEQETDPDHKSASSFFDSIHIVHSSVFEPQMWRYIIRQEAAERVLPAQQQKIVFFGHTHVPASYAFHPKTGAFKSVMPSRTGTLKLDPEWKWLINPGSVGQPRDKDPRAAYLIYDPVESIVEQRRVEYDFKKTAKKIMKAQLPITNAKRLYIGK